MKKRICCHILILTGLLAVVGVWAAAPALADPVTVAANFTDGNSEALVDAWHGVAGLGWAGPWGEFSYNGPVFTATVDNANPLDGGGNYLDYSCGSTDTGRAVVGRTYKCDEDNPLGVDVVPEHTVSWKFRIDETQVDFDANFTDGVDFYMMHDIVPLFGRQVNFSGNQASWIISAWGAADLDYIPVAREWLAYNGDPGNSDWDIAHQVQTGVPLVPDVVYDMTVTNRARASETSWGRYDLTIDATIGVTEYNYDSTTIYPDGLGWRNTEASAYGLAGIPDFSARCSDTVDVRQFSLDALTITGESCVPPLPVKPGPFMSPVVARFTDGNDDTTYVDAYHGIAGNGWDSAWVDTTSHATTTHQVLGDGGVGEIKTGSGRYLSFSATHDETTSVMNATVSRDYVTEDPDPGINWTGGHRIQFTMRIDENVDSEFLFTDADDKYLAFQSPSAQNGSSPACIWQAAVVAIAPDPLMDGKWLFSDGSNDGSYVDVNTGIDIATDGVYDFTIIIDPTTLTYDAIITDGTTTWNSTENGFADGLGWRTSATTLGGYLGFGGRANSFEDTRAFSLDDLVITQVPGDADGDGDVDADDLQRLAQNWGAGTVEEPATWAEGNFDDDHFVGPKDAAILAAAWGTVNWGDGAGGEGAAGVPEPSAIVLLLGAIASLMGWRRR